MIVVSFKRGASLAFALQSEAEAAKRVGLSAEELLIYQGVEKSTNEGTTVKELRAASNLPQHQVSKILKQVLVQPVKSVMAKKKVAFAHARRRAASPAGPCLRRAHRAAAQHAGR